MARSLLIAAAIIAAGAMVSASVLFLSRWSIVASPEAAYRLDRWTGAVVACHVSPGMMGYRDFPIPTGCTPAR